MSATTDDGARAVITDDSDFRNTHGHAPCGVGYWAFASIRPGPTDEYLNGCIWVRGEFATARETAVHIAAECGIAVLYVCA